MLKQPVRVPVLVEPADAHRPKVPKQHTTHTRTSGGTLSLNLEALLFFRSAKRVPIPESVDACRDDILSVLCQSSLVVEIRMMRADIQRARLSRLSPFLSPGSRNRDSPPKPEQRPGVGQYAHIRVPPEALVTMPHAPCLERYVAAVCLTKPNRHHL